MGTADLAHAAQRTLVDEVVENAVEWAKAKSPKMPKQRLQDFESGVRMGAENTLARLCRRSGKG